MSIKVHVPFEDPAQHLFDPTKLEVADGVGRMIPKILASEIGYWNFDEDGDAESKRGGLTLDLPDYNIANPSSAVIQNGWLEMKGSDYTYGYLNNIPKIDSGNNPAFRTKIRVNFTTVTSSIDLIILSNNENSAEVKVYLQNQGGGVSRVWGSLKDNAGTVVYGGILGLKTFAINDIFEIGFSRDETSGKYYFILDGVKVGDITATVKFDTMNVNVGGPYNSRTNWSYDDLQLWNGLERPNLVIGQISEEDTTYSKDYSGMITVAPLLMDKFNSFDANYRYAEAGEVMHQLMLNSQYWWFNVADDSWEEVTEVSHINTPAELIANVSKLELEGGVGKYIQIVTYFKSNDGYKTPEILDIDVDYRFYFSLGAGLPRCIVFGSVVDSSGQSVQGAKVTIWGKDFFHGNTYVTRNSEYITNVNGKWDIQVVETETVGKTANITIEYTDSDGSEVKKDFKNLIIPNQNSIEFQQLLLDNGKTL